MPETASSAIPSIAARYITPAVSEVHLVIGGVMVSVGVVVEACEILAESPGLMVRQPLARYCNPLALCDYHAEAAPYRERFHRKLTFTGRGAAGRPATKHAFMHALQVRADNAMRQAPMVAAMPLAAEAMAAMACDVSYVMAMSKMAVSLLARQHQWRLRSELRQAEQAAMAACIAQDGEFTCDNKTACGTGACRFATGIYKMVSADAGEGRTARPANHCGESFAAESALSEIEKLVPFRVQVALRGRGQVSQPLWLPWWFTPNTSDGNTGWGACRSSSRHRSTPGLSSRALSRHRRRSCWTTPRL